MFGTELLSFDETSDGITAHIDDLVNGQRRAVRCRYMIAADGSKSLVRERLRVRMLGPGVLNHNISIHFSAHLERHMPLGPNFLHFVQNKDVTGMFVATERWRVGSVFLAGDAAHRMTPAGGLGMNTAIQDVHNLCWKLAAVLQGWAGADVLDTYEAERRPVAQQNVQRSVALITGAGGAGDRSALDFDLGSTYESTAVFAGREPARATGEYIPVARPGSRAPHVWLSAGRDRVSTLDVFGPRFTLLAGPGDEVWRMAAIEIAAELGVKLQYRTAACSGTDRAKWEAAYGVAEGGAVLIRPDGHVAWRRAAAVPDPAGELRLVLNSVLGLRRDSRMAAPHSLLAAS